MRFYHIEFSGQINATFTSLIDGVFDPGALDVELDINESTGAAPTQNSGLRIYGIPLQPSDGNPVAVSQASDLNGCTIRIYAGFSRGLPLATAAVEGGQQGLIAQGQIYQAWGNWLLTEMTVDMTIYASAGGNQSAPANFTFNWKKGSDMATQIKALLFFVMPGWTVNVAISPKLILTEDQAGVYQTFDQFAQAVNVLSKSIITDPAYIGVDMVQRPGEIVAVYDRTDAAGTINGAFATPAAAGAPTTVGPTSVQGAAASATGAKPILFQDLMGQPTWFGVAQVQFNCPMRADINVGDFITFPRAQTTSTEAENQLQAKDRAAFQGTFQIQTIRHVGRFRDPMGTSWITTFQAIAMPTAGSNPYEQDAQGGNP